jgi:S-adenosylmethionine:tRNA ribosyltransferase-isomerase
MYNIEDYDYSLPKDLIAQHPVSERDRSRLLRLDRETGSVTHHRFEDILSLLAPSDLLVVNNTQVVPARLIGKKTTGGRVELLILDYPELISGAKESDCLLKASKAVKPGTRFTFDDGLEAEVTGRANGTFRVRFFGTADIEQTIEAVGRVPLPPYIKRNDADPVSGDRATYQTVYAREKGAIAAPTAGLHFTPGLLEKIRNRGILVEEITLHVGYGTFFPVKSADIRKHRMHSESYRIPEAVAHRITRHRKSGGRVVAVGTTCVRTLEYATDSSGLIQAGDGSCDLFIRPGYRFRTVGAMITNFHLPKSTLIMLVSAFAGREKVLAAYREAIDKKYRFYSYGDAMFIQ